MNPDEENVDNEQQEDEWQVCVSCGGPAKGDFCGFCLEEE